jgi:hypothetical protein
VYEVGDALSPLTGRIDADLHRELTAMKDAFIAHPADAAAASGPYAKAVVARLAVHLDKLSAGDAAAFKVNTTNTMQALFSKIRVGQDRLIFQCFLWLSHWSFGNRSVLMGRCC